MGSRSVTGNAKNARGPFPSRARLNFTFNKFPLRILSESLAQAKGKSKRAGKYGTKKSKERREACHILPPV